MNDPLQESKAAQDRQATISLIRHELRTPLNAILGYTELLHEEANERHDPEIADALTEIMRTGESMLELTAICAERAMNAGGSDPAFQHLSDANDRVKSLASKLKSTPEFGREFAADFDAIFSACENLSGRIAGLPRR